MAVSAAVDCIIGDGVSLSEPSEGVLVSTWEKLGAEGELCDKDLEVKHFLLEYILVDETEVPENGGIVPPTAVRKEVSFKNTALLLCCSCINYFHEHTRIDNFQF